MHKEDVCVVSVGMILQVYECVETVCVRECACLWCACMWVMCEEGCECVYKGCVCRRTVHGRELLDMCVVST